MDQCKNIHKVGTDSNSELRFTLAAQFPFPLEKEGGLIGEERVETFMLIHLHEEG
jgi:hypothetical protein